MKYLSYLLTLIAFYLLYSFACYVIDLRDFKSNVLLQTQKITAQTKEHETKINEAFSFNSQQATKDIAANWQLYNDLINERVLQYNDASGQSVPAAAAPASHHEPTSKSRPLDKSAELSKKLLKCEKYLLYEAKEYDTLASHYNVLLKTYEQVRLINEQSSNTRPTPH